MTEQTVNIPLLRKAVEWADAEAAKPVELCEWYQPAYIIKPEEREAEAKVLTPDESPAILAIGQKSPDCGTCYCIAGYIGSLGGHDSETGVSDFARHQLGIRIGDSFELFDGDNTIEDVRRIAESIAGERL